LEKWISPTMPDFAKFGQKTQGILGVKCSSKALVGYNRDVHG
jgi:hypothetical protein